MKLYRTRTKDEYDWLMQKLEDEGCFWVTGKKPTELNYIKQYEVVSVGKFRAKEMWRETFNTADNRPIIEVSDLMEEKQMKFKVDDKVRVREDLEIDKQYGEEVFVESMVKFKGKTVEIDGVLGHGYNLKKDDENWVFTDEMLEPIEDPLSQKVLERNNKPESLEEPLDLIANHKRICEQLNRVYRDKNHDYGNSFGETYQKLGAISAVTRISDKTSRLQSLVTKDEQRVDDERLIDTALDLANYAIMFAMELEEEE